MGAWGIKALERDEGLDVLDILKNEYVPEHPVMDLGEMIELMKEEVMLGSDFSQIDFLFDNTAMALAELYFQWKDNGKLDYDHEEAIWDKVTGFTASKEALAFLLRQLTDIKNEVPDEDGIREIMDLWKNEDSGEIAPAWLEHLNQLIDRLDSEQEARQMYIKKYWGNFIGGSDDSLNLVAFLEDQKRRRSPSARFSPRSVWTSRTGTFAKPWSTWSLHIPMVWRWTFTSPLMWSPTWPPSCWSAASVAV